jgi:hypothetical protein
MSAIERSHLDAIGSDTPAADLAKSLRFVANWTLSPPHPVPLQEAARRLDRMAELEAIVRDLAASNPAPDYWCFICGHERGNHAPVCAFGRAREWVERHA